MRYPLDVRMSIGCTMDFATSNGRIVAHHKNIGCAIDGNQMYVICRSLTVMIWTSLVYLRNKQDVHWIAHKMSRRCPWCKSMEHVMDLRLHHRALNQRPNERRNYHVVYDAPIPTPNG